MRGMGLSGAVAYRGCPAGYTCAMRAHDDRDRRRLLTRGRRQATGLLVAVAAVFVAIQVGGDATWVGYLEATVAAGMVGGLADWFAVTRCSAGPCACPSPTRRSSSSARTPSDAPWATSCRPAS